MIKRLNVFYKGLGSEEPGGAASYAWAVYEDETLRHTVAKFLEPEAKLSRFVAEYKAIMEAMQWLIENGEHPHHVRFHGDEALIVNHLNRRWKPKHELFPLCRQAQFIQAGLMDVHFNWIPVSKNLALAAAKTVLLEHQIDPQPYLDAQEKLTRKKIASGEYK